MESLCLDKQTCSVGANNDEFGDPCSGVGKKLAVVYACGASGPVSGSEMPVFLLAGQSNLVGNVDRTLFNQLMSELESGTPGTRQQRLFNRLKSWYQNSDAYSAQAVTFEASELLRLNREGLVNASLTQPYSKVYCASSDSPLQPLALNCGNP